MVAKRMRLSQDWHPQQPRSRAMIDAMRPLQFHAGTELDVVTVHVFDEIDDATGQVCIAIGLMTKSGTRTVILPVRLAAELGENLLWLAGRRAWRPGRDDGLPDTQRPLLRRQAHR